MKKYLYLLVVFVAISTHLFAGGAGVLPMTIDPNGDAVFLLGKEHRFSRRQNRHFEAWSDFGGQQDPGESLNQTAYREFTEETGYKNFLNFNQQHVNNSPYIDYRSPIGFYRLYFLDMDSYFKPVEVIKKTAAEVSAQFRAERQRSYIEKSDWCYVHAERLLNDINNGQHGLKHLPDSNGQEVIFGLLSEVLQQPQSRAIVTDFINAAKLKKISSPPLSSVGSTPSSLSSQPVISFPAADSPVVKITVTENELAPLLSPITAQHPILKPTPKKVSITSMTPLISQKSKRQEFTTKLVSKLNAKNKVKSLPSKRVVKKTVVKAKNKKQPLRKPIKSSSQTLKKNHLSHKKNARRNKSGRTIIKRSSARLIKPQSKLKIIQAKYKKRDVSHH